MSAIVSPALSWASRVLAPRCGVTTTESMPNSGDSVVGSVAKTSRAAPATVPSRSASARAASSTIPPRATLIDAQPRLGLEQQVATDQPGRLGSLRQVDGEEVGLGDDLLEGHQLDPAEAGALGRHVRVEGDEAHAEATGPVGDELADASEADDAERLVGEFDTLPLAALPASVDERGVRLRDVAGLGEQQRHRVLGRRDDVRLRGVDDHHAASRRGIEVDVVEADPGPADDHQVVGGGEQLGVDRRGRADDQRLGPGDRREQLVRATARAARRRRVRRKRGAAARCRRSLR